MERMTAADYKAAQRDEKGQGEDRRRVRGTKRTTTADGITHDSKTEADRWEELKLLQASGAICGLRRQAPIPLIGRDGPIMTDSGNRQRVYKADFVYVDNALGVTVVEDRKGHETNKFKLVKSVLAAQGIELLITRAN
ncbi:DUF1064 domain-containing protein [Phaeobacter inhibens]|uniref:DUF1064 domain-containing protein n=1 Tax=Phaeobacter inhibens TaxID=221822 RepID=UPI00076BB82C|nr:DUF1064 domain-containing protein [Phaeobacter inhibens]KXF89758.1 hypothetical protein AT574_14195 [Phaeobacter inhibens]WHP69302.1 DUF1064 domain-containing protein [Phaeobacter inhibens]